MLSKEQISVAFTNNSTIDLTYSFNGTIIATYNPQRQLEGTFGYGLGKGILSVYNSSMNYLKKTSIYSYFSSTTNQPKKVAIIKALTKKNLADLHILEKNIINSHKLNNVVASINKFYDTIPLFLRADVSAMKNFNSRIKKAIINRYSDNQQLSNFCLNLNEIAKTQLDLVYTGSQIDSYTKSEALLSGSIQELNKENLYTHINPTINEELLYQELSNFIRNEMNKNMGKPILFILGELHDEENRHILESLFISALKEIINEDPVVYIEANQKDYDTCIVANKAKGCDTYSYRLATQKSSIPIEKIIPCDINNPLEIIRKYGTSCKNAYLTPRDIHIASQIKKTTAIGIESKNCGMHPPQVSLGGEDHLYGLQKELKDDFYVIPVFLYGDRENKCRQTLDLDSANNTEEIKSLHHLNFNGWQVDQCAVLGGNHLTNENAKLLCDLFHSQEDFDSKVVTNRCNIEKELKYAVDWCKHRLGVDTDVYSIDLASNEILHHYDAQKKYYSSPTVNSIKKDGKQKKYAPIN